MCSHTPPLQALVPCIPLSIPCSLHSECLHSGFLPSHTTIYAWILTFFLPFFLSICTHFGFLQMINYAEFPCSNFLSFVCKMVALYLRDGILKATLNLKYAFVKLMWRMMVDICLPATVALPLQQSQCHQSSFLPPTLGFLKKPFSSGHLHNLVYVHKIQTLYFNCTILDVHFSQLYSYDYRLHGDRAIYFVGKLKD